MKMKITIPLLTILLLLTVTVVQAEAGLINVSSQFGVQETADRFVAAVEKAGLKVFNRIDHAAGAAKVDKSLRPTQLIIFGSPKVGTALLTSDQRIGIDLPLKALAWQDAEGKVWLSYNSPDYLFNRFAINDRAKVKKKITGALAKLSQSATQP
ncbi:MAG: DUF302 domain-containing protein [Candidatus Thiodiazotropha sp. (ex Lucinoma annulata)]|nr:DUF302 domain-containing protein [Candidatus Thiodiazotropha sp. (ex Lucinoma borealis)]MCU7841170.1 DUF302 domain-containing protein [Candidatus Thiodiazotropha sp. (ex Troendleina suluensis)]MCU7882974.1 DUF302 domain-containing protein [Candidatus Thiodiazotropha sp. (ex Lucinoma annulata)]MCU7856763.1 DUF302 domain-containing protein [Candidatus Thiodiazotropha sp. (ex Lucinoma borealis)]MCU7866417.1 DUF302 domain-containing protein [Candidatus Thiodiazotropha sp. (ex Lucinoma borealis)]